MQCSIYFFILHLLLQFSSAFQAFQALFLPRSMESSLTCDKLCESMARGVLVYPGHTRKQILQKMEFFYKLRKNRRHI